MNITITRHGIFPKMLNKVTLPALFRGTNVYCPLQNQNGGPVMFLGAFGKTLSTDFKKIVVH